jgi:hypothetical protein
MRHTLYLVYGIILLGLAGMAEYRGWSLLRPNEFKSVPKTIRDNPGSYRSHYMFYSHYTGGK